MQHKKWTGYAIVYYWQKYGSTIWWRSIKMFKLMVDADQCLFPTLVASTDACLHYDSSSHQGQQNSCAKNGGNSTPRFSATALIENETLNEMIRNWIRFAWKCNRSPRTCFQITSTFWAQMDLTIGPNQPYEKNWNNLNSDCKGYRNTKAIVIHRWTCVA